MHQYPDYRSSDTRYFKSRYKDRRFTEYDHERISNLGKIWLSLDSLRRASAHGSYPGHPDKFGNCALHYAAGLGHVDLVKWLTQHLSAEELGFRDTVGRTGLHLAVIEKHVEIVKILVEAEIDVNVRDNDGMTPLHFAWVGVDGTSDEGIEQYDAIVEILVSSRTFRRFVDEPVGGEKLYSITVLSWAVLLKRYKTVRLLLEEGLDLETPCQAEELITPLHIAADYGSYKMISFLLEYSHYKISWMVNKGDYHGRTPLHMAVRGGHLECTKILIDNGGSLAHEDKDGLTVVHLLFKRGENQVAFLTQLLDVGVSTKKSEDKNLCMVDLKFNALAPEGALQMSVLTTLIRVVHCKVQMNVLQHPLVETFVLLKWKRLRHFFVILVMFQALFVASLFAYGIILLQEQGDHPVPRRVLFVSSVVMLCHNILQILMLPKYYTKHFETWFSVSCVTICIVVAAEGEFMGDHPRYIERSPSWVLQGIGVAIPLACIQMMLLIGRFPAWGNYALMFATVLQNVFKISLAVVWVVIGFSLSFSILFHNNEQFDDPGKAFVKTVVMMMGEYDYGNLFATMDEKNSTRDSAVSNESKYILLPIVSRVVFLIFIILASIVLLNLMVGCAVTDIQELMNEGRVLRLMKQAVFATHLERLTSHWIFRCRWMPERIRNMLESRNRISTEMILVATEESSYKIMNQFCLETGVSRGMAPLDISEKLAEKLFELALTNDRLRGSSCQPMHSPDSDNEDSLAETFLQFEEVYEKLQREITRIRGTRAFARPISRRQPNITDADL